MALSYPRHMTATKAWKAGGFTLKEYQELSPQGSGDLWAKDLSEPKWQVSYLSKPVDINTREAWLADFRSLRGSVRTGYFHNVESGWLKAYSQATAATHSYATAEIASIAGDKSALSIDGLPVGLQITAGDFVTVATSVGVECYQFLESGTVNGSGVLASLAVTPPVSDSVAINNDITMYQPYIEGVIVPDSLSWSDAGDYYYTISVDVMQRRR